MNLLAIPIKPPIPPPPPPPWDFIYIFNAISPADVTADCLSAPGACHPPRTTDQHAILYS